MAYSTARTITFEDLYRKVNEIEDEGDREMADLEESVQDLPVFISINGEHFRVSDVRLVKPVEAELLEGEDPTDEDKWCIVIESSDH